MANSKSYNVVVEFRGTEKPIAKRTPNCADIFDSVAITSPRTGKTLWLCGTWDGDTCMDIRNRIAVATKMGMSKASISVTVEDLRRWADSHGLMVDNYDPSR